MSPPSPCLAYNSTPTSTRLLSPFLSLSYLSPSPSFYLPLVLRSLPFSNLSPSPSFYLPHVLLSLPLSLLLSPSPYSPTNSVWRPPPPSPLFLSPSPSPCPSPSPSLSFSPIVAEQYDVNILIWLTLRGHTEEGRQSRRRRERKRERDKEKEREKDRERERGRLIGGGES
ncbi:hypothetical protein AAC387_Pa06g0451 [Persea americana]